MKKWLGSQKFDTLKLVKINSVINKLQWSDAHSVIGDSAVTYDIVPITLDTIAKFDDPALGVNKYLVLTKINGTITGSTQVELFGNKTVLNTEKDKLVANYNHKTQGQFTGIVTLSDIYGAYKESKQYITGNIMLHKVFQARGKNNGKTTLSTSGKILDGCTDYYLVTYYTDGSSDWEYLFTTCSGGCVAITSVIDHKSTQSLVTDCANSSGGGGTSTTTGSKSITNQVVNKCLSGMVQATISANVTNKINTLIQKIFGSSTTMNITFVDVNNLPANVDGSTNLNGGLVNGKLNVQIQLDNNHLPNYSQQYIARVIMHEALHAYLTSVGTSEDQQHETMMISYVTQMATALQQMFPGLSTGDAQNLSLGGLQVSATFQNTIEKDMGLSGSFGATNLAYSIGALGNRCEGK